MGLQGRAWPLVLVSKNGAAPVSILAALMAATACDAPPPSAPEPGVVETTEGPVRGIVRDDTPVWEYRGIPYAAPPTGERRFRAPALPAVRDELLLADTYGPVCPQLATGIWDTCHDGAAAGELVGDEDCLSLNVMVPAAREPGERLPVLVYVHGGGFVFGCGRIGSGAFAHHGDVVVVGLNYRLGLLGFMSSSAIAAGADDGALANWGVLDVVRGLEWVHENIAAFGGDADNVTLMGQSAGGVAVCALAASPLGAELFARVGVLSARCDVGRPLEALIEAGDQSAAALGCAGEGEGALACLRAQPASDLVLHQAQLVAAGTNPAELTLDGHVLEAPALATLLTSGSGARDLLVGSTREEIPVTDPAVIAAIEADYEGTLIATAHGGGLTLPPEVLLDLYPAPADPAERVAAFEAFLSDTVFNCAALDVARTFDALGARAFLYEFSQNLSPALPEVEALGAYHALDMAYVLGELEQLQYLGYFADESDHELSERMIRAYAGFIRSGTPDAAPAWPALSPPAVDYYDWSKDASAPVRSDYRGGRCDRLRDALIAVIAGGG